MSERRCLDAGADNDAHGFVAHRPPGALRLARSAAGQAVEAVASLVTLPVRAIGLLGAAELLVTRVTVLVGRIEEMVARVTLIATDAEEMVRDVRAVVHDVEATAGRAALAVAEVEAVIATATLAVREAAAVAAGAATVVRSADGVSADAAAVVIRAAAAAGEADALLAAYSPTLRTGAPMARRFVEHVTADEVTAAIRIVDQLPRLLEHLTTDVLPILATVERVGPDIHALLEATRDLQLAVAGLPGLKMLRRRGEEKLADGND
jgi:hypothetical protein